MARGGRKGRFPGAEEKRAIGGKKRRKKQGLSAKGSQHQEKKIASSLTPKKRKRARREGGVAGAQKREKNCCSGAKDLGNSVAKTGRNRGLYLEYPVVGSLREKGEKGELLNQKGGKELISTFGEGGRVVKSIS